jgi:hypothetical protein
MPITGSEDKKNPVIVKINRSLLKKPVLALKSSISSILEPTS